MLSSRKQRLPHGQPQHNQRDYDTSPDTHCAISFLSPTSKDISHLVCYCTSIPQPISLTNTLNKIEDNIMQTAKQQARLFTTTLIYKPPLYSKQMHTLVPSHPLTAPPPEVPSTLHYHLHSPHPLLLPQSAYRPLPRCSVSLHTSSL